MDIGLYYYNARYYVPTLARFVSADTIVPDPANPQSFNRYSYVENRPLNFNDPTGHCAEGYAGDDYEDAGCLEIAQGVAYKYGFSFSQLAKKEWQLMESDGSYNLGALATDSIFVNEVGYELVTINGRVAAVNNDDVFHIWEKTNGGYQHALILSEESLGFRVSVDSLIQSRQDAAFDVIEFSINTGDTLVSAAEVAYGILQELGYAGVAAGTGGVAAPVVGIDALDEVGEIILGTAHVVSGGLDSIRLGASFVVSLNNAQSAMSAANYEFDRLIRHNKIISLGQ